MTQGIEAGGNSPIVEPSPVTDSQTILDLRRDGPNLSSLSLELQLAALQADYESRVADPDDEG